MVSKFVKIIPKGLVSIVTALIICYLSLANNPLDVNKIHLFAGADKVAHAIMYFALTTAFIFDYLKFIYPHHTKLNKELALGFASIVFGVLMEAGQGLMDTGRDMSFMDGCFNAVGAILAFLIFHYFLMKRVRGYLRVHHYHRHHSHSLPFVADEKG